MDKKETKILVVDDKVILSKIYYRKEFTNGRDNQITMRE